MNLHGKKILIVKLRYIGDTLSIVPVVENLKAQVSGLRVDVMVNRGTEAVVAHHPLIDQTWVYDRQRAKESIGASAAYHLGLARKLRSRNYDAVIDFTHGDRAAFLCAVTGAPLRITYQSASRLSHFLMNQIVVADPFQYHIVDLQLLSLTLFGLTRFSRRMNIHVPAEKKQKVDSLLRRAVGRAVAAKAVIHPGARGKLRQWRPQRFAEIARRLKQTYQTAIILIGGPGESALIDAVEKHMGFCADFRSTQLSLLEMAALLAQSSLFVGSDSAPGHIAAAVDCPTVTLFGPTFPHMWRPLSPLGEVVFKNVSCCGCPQETCIRPENNCMDMISVDEVWRKVRKIAETIWRLPSSESSFS